MKQLLLYFLFFVGAAFIFIQCAKLFPSSNKSLKRESKSPAITDPAQGKKLNKTAFFTPGDQTIKPGFKTFPLSSYFNTRTFPLNMMKYIRDYSLYNYYYHWGNNYKESNRGPFLLNRYMSFSYTQLLIKNEKGLQADNSVGVK